MVNIVLWVERLSRWSFEDELPELSLMASVNTKYAVLTVCEKVFSSNSFPLIYLIKLKIAFFSILH